MAIAFNLQPVHQPRKITSVGDATSQFADFSGLYRQLWDFVEDGGLDAFGIDQEDLARWRRAFRDGVVNIGGRPSEIDFFRMMMGGTPKECDATDLSIEYNSAVDFNIYAENDATGTTGTVTGGCYYNQVVNGNYTGPYVSFTIATDTYANNGQLSNVNVGDQIYIYNDSQWITVIKKDTTVDFAHVIYAVPMDENYVVSIYAKQPMLPNHVQMVSGYSDSTTSLPHSEWETLGYIKTISPFSLRTDWETPRNLEKAYKDIVQFPIIFDMVTGAEMESFDFKAMADGRERMIMAENMLFFSGQTMNNSVVNNQAYSNQYFGFEGLLTTMFYGGGNIQQYDNTYGWDLEFDWMQIVFANDALKKSTEFLLLCAKRFTWNLQRRSQDMFKNNAGACTFNTFERMGEGAADIKRLGINSYAWSNNTVHIREVGAWSDSRWVGNTYFPNMGIALPGDGLTDSKGNKVAPVEYWLPKGRRLSGMWSEVWRDHMQLSDKADMFSGTITHDVMMSVNGVENMYAIMPKYTV